MFSREDAALNGLKTLKSDIRTPQSPPGGWLHYSAVPKMKQALLQ